MGEKQFGFPPILLVDAVFHPWRIDLALYQPGIFKLPQMLGNGGLCSRYDFNQVAGKAAGLRIQQLQDLQPGRVPQCLGKPGQLLVGIFRNGLLC